MMLVGVIWAVFAPLLLLPIIFGIAYMLRRRGWAKALALAAVVVLVPVLAIYMIDRAAFSDFCTDMGEPVITSRADADGVFLNSQTANSFGIRYLTSEGFDWIERRDIYNRDGFVRVTNTSDSKFTEIKDSGADRTIRSH